MALGGGGGGGAVTMATLSSAEWFCIKMEALWAILNLTKAALSVGPN